MGEATWEEGAEVPELWSRILLRGLTESVFFPGPSSEDAPEDEVEVFALLLDLRTIRIVERVEEEYQRFIRDDALGRTRTLEHYKATE